VPQDGKKFRQPTEQERLQEYFWQLERLIPNPPRDWAKSARPCKWAKIIEEQKESNGREEETGSLCQHSREERTD
jgi:hypothetical protein